MIRLDSWEEITFQFTIVAQNCDLGMNKGEVFGILLGFQIWVYRSDRKECLTSRDDSPTRFAGAPSEREPFAQTRGNSL
ncbi:MAG: hypothetical protein J6B24_04870, partial [Clostridia bacterium]|nr:hypothetical protein [Clostridia bacterium]